MIFFKRECDQLDFQEYVGSTQGPTVLFIGSVHGNEPAGTLALEDYFDYDFVPKKGRVMVVTRPNRCGQFLNMRWQPQYIPYFSKNLSDLNRSIHKDTRNHVANELTKLIEQSDLVVDLHEGWGFHQLQPSSMGSCVYPSKKVWSLGETIVSNINKTIPDAKKQFLVRQAPELKNTTDEFAQSLGKNSIVVETTGQNNIQPVQLRVYQQKIVINTVLEQLGMI